jgi:ATP-binding cassette subfamily B protein/subfamily B ATP-binding cassette protein MsbA
MPPRGQFFSADDLQGKVYDSKLFGRLITYLRPYWLYVSVAMLLLLLVAAAQIGTPLITMYAVDNIIASRNDAMVFASVHEAQAVLEEAPHAKATLHPTPQGAVLSFAQRKRNLLPAELLAAQQDAGTYYQRVAFIPDTPANRAVLDSLFMLPVADSTLMVQAPQLLEALQSGTITKAQLKSLRSNDIHRLLMVGLLYFGIIIVQLLLSYFQIWFINHASQHAMYDLRRDVFARVERMPLSFFDTNPIGRLVTRVTNDVRTLDEMLSNGLIQLVQQIIVLVGILITMFVLNWRFALVTLSVLPLVIVLMVIFNRSVRKIYRKVRKRLAAINSTLSEDISGVKIIQLFNQYRHKVGTFTELNQHYYEASMQQLRLFAFFRPLINSTRRIAVALILWYGGGQILEGAITLGLFIVFFDYIDRFFEPISQLSEKFNILQAAMSGAERIFDLIDKEEEDYRLPLHSDVRLKGAIDFDAVTMAYNDNGDVLKEISFSVKPGEKVALVGHTGSGKTSIISLLAGLYPYQQGSIRLDGKELSQYSLHDIRDNIGIVQQDVFIFSGTIRDNIALNNHELSDERIKQVAEYVNVHRFIESLPQKYNEPVMERGATFSVGQRQLLAFARVLAYDPAIFVLDEATSNIDTETELLIQDALQKVMENRTSIIIAHRLSTIQHVDRIIVLHKGRIVETGSHQELLAKEGLYYDLYRLQYT